MTENLPGAPGIKRRFGRAFAIGRLREFGDECWRSVQLVVVFVTAAFLFGAPSVSHHASTPAVSAIVAERPAVFTTVVTVSEVVADPMRPTILP